MTTPAAVGDCAEPSGWSVAGLLDVAERLTADDAGKLLQWDGSEHPW